MEQYEEPRSNNSLLKAGLVLAVALAGLFSYLYFTKKTELEGQIATKNTIISENTRDLMITNSKLDSISNQLDLKIAEIQALGGTVEELQAAKRQLLSDKKTLVNSNQVDLAKYESKIRDFEALLSTKDAEIARLKEENQVLTGQNQTLSRENTGLKTEVTGLQKDKASLSDSVYNVTVQNRELSDKVTIAAALRVVNLQVNALNSRGKERDGGEYKARRVDKIKVGFKLAENQLTKRDEKEIFMRLVDPNGNVISDMATGSGVFSFAGKETVYTTKQKVMYTNNGQNVEFVYQRGTNYEKGTYNIELYSESFRIGTGSFTIK
jgi:predicted  nucleic acid-binding Zn-ribbon protein